MSRTRSIILTCAWLCITGVCEAIESQTVLGSQDLPIQVIEAGDRSKPGILFVHGWSLSSSSWAEQFSSDLSNDFHLVALDLRGHGNSGKPWQAESYSQSKIWADDIDAVLNATGLVRPLIIAWSFGGHVTMDYLRHYPAHSVAGVIFVGSSGGMLPFPQPDAETAVKYARLTELSLSANASERLEAARSYVANMVETPLKPEQLDREVAAALAMPPYVRRAMLGRSLDNSDQTDRLVMPVLFLLGSAERNLSVDDAQILARQLPNASISVYPGTGHMPFVEQTKKFNNEVKLFYRGLLARD